MEGTAQVPQCPDGNRGIPQARPTKGGESVVPCGPTLPPDWKARRLALIRQRYERLIRKKRVEFEREIAEREREGTAIFGEDGG